ncbi:MAG: glycosyltransferase [Anaerolineales bacterium]|nr:glycosyltransferase [Anaerolineales bacterium]
MRNLKTTPKISIVIPAFNAEYWIARTINSVLSQTLQDLEIIVIDDGSTDGTRNIVEAIKDNRIQYHYQENRGLSGARNSGILASTGRFIALLDADDLFKPKKLAYQVELMEKEPDLGLVTCGIELIDQYDNHIGEERHWLFHPTIDLDHLLFWNPLLPSTLLIRREWFERVGLFDESLRRYEDWEFPIRLAAAGCRMEYVREILVSYRRHTVNMSSAVELVHVATDDAVRMITSFFEREDIPEHTQELKEKVMGNVYLDATARAYEAGLLDEGRKWLETAIAFDPDLTSGDPPQWVIGLSGFAQGPLVDDEEVFTKTLMTNLPQSPEFKNWTIREFKTQMNVTKAFEMFFAGQRSKARWYAIIAIVSDLSLILRNHGLLVIGFRPW